MDPFVKLTRVPRRPPWTDVLIAGALLAWALTETLLESGPGPLAGRVAFAVVVTVPLAVSRITLADQGWPGAVAGVSGCAAGRRRAAPL